VATTLPTSDDEMRVAMRQIVGVFSQLEKTRLVKKLKAARDRKRAHGKVEGRKTRLERVKDQPEASEAFLQAIATAKRLHRANQKTGKRRSLREIGKALAAAGLHNEQGREYHPESIRRMIDGPGDADLVRPRPNPKE
jgi:DNA invertase Pin-like site-specific DNA recombinase